MGLSPIAGRVFPEDPAPRGCRGGVINQEAAELYFGGNAVGGAVIDVRADAPRSSASFTRRGFEPWQQGGEPAIYFPMAQDFLPRMTLILGAREPNDAMLASVRRRLDAMPGGTPGGGVVSTLEAHLSRTALAPERIATVLHRLVRRDALTLGVLGLYGTMTDAAGRRRRELAVRIALGAQGWNSTVQAQPINTGNRFHLRSNCAAVLG